MTDLHNHSLFAVDDGCQLTESSLQTIQEEAEYTSDIFLTPHIDTADTDFNKITTNFHILNEKLKENNINVTLHLGGEVSPDFYPSQVLNKGIDITMGQNSNYILIGCIFTPELCENQLNNVIYDIQIMGKTPILAHPERMIYFQNDPELLFKYLNQGCLLQLNGPSLYGKYGESCKDFAEKILKLKWISFVATDNHRPHNYSVMKRSYDLVKNLTDENTANTLMKDNPQKIINNEKLYNNDFKDWIEEKKQKKSLFFNFFKK